MSEPKWYAVHTLSGQEMKVKRYLEESARLRGFEEKILRVLVPLETVVEMRQGKRRGSQRKFFPGYVLVEMKLDEETRKLIEEAPGVTSFVKTGFTKHRSDSSGKNIAEIVPLEQHEIDRILARVEGSKFQKKLEIPYKVGDPVKVIDGPFKDFVGVVSDVNQERGKVKVMISMFGRLTPVEVDFLQLKEDEG